MQTETNVQGLAQARMMHKISIALAIVLFLGLVAAFSFRLAAYYQVAAGLAAYIAVEWQRACGRKVTALSNAGSPRSDARTA